MARPESAKYRLLENPVMRLGSNWDRYPNINRRLNIKKIVIKKETVLLFFKVLIPFSVRSMLHLIIWWGENLPLLPGIISLMMKTFPCFLRNHQITADVVLAVKDFYISIYFFFLIKKWELIQINHIKTQPCIVIYTQRLLASEAVFPGHTAVIHALVLSRNFHLSFHSVTHSNLFYFPPEVSKGHLCCKHSHLNIVTWLASNSAE